MCVCFGKFLQNSSSGIIIKRKQIWGGSAARSRERTVLLLCWIKIFHPIGGAAILNCWGDSLAIKVRGVGTSGWQQR